MPLNDNFYNPGAAATNALLDLLTQQEAKKRQAMLDEITRTTAARQDEVARANLELQREQMQGLREQREAAADLNRQKKALGIISNLRPNQDVDDPTAADIEAGGFGSMLLRGAPTQGALITAPEDDPEGVPTYEVVPGKRQFAGTPQQIALQGFIDDPNTTEPQRAFMRARLAAGDENLPYQLFQGPETQTLFRVSNDRRNVERFDGQGWVTHEGAIPKDAHWLTEPSSQSDDLSKMQRVSTFNRIADAFERSPLVKAADRTIVLKNTADRVLKNPSDASNASTQLNLAYTYIQALDTYQSAVGEGELANLGALGTKLEVIGANMIRYLPREAGGQGQVMPPEVAREIAAEATRLVELIESGRKRKEQEFKRRAKASGVEEMWDATYPSATPTNTSTPTNTPASSPAAAPANPFRH